MRATSARLLAGALTLACAGLVACGGEGRAYIEASAVESAAADRALSRGEASEAVAHLRRIAEREPPASVALEDARVIRQDAYERWARVVLERGDPHAARALVARGLSLGERDDVFTANLLTARGRAHEAAGRDREAARDYHRALRIEEMLLERALGDGP